jgi:hypothetical protein
VARSNYSSHVNLQKNEGEGNQRDLVRKLYHIVRLARQCCRKTSGVNKDLQVLSGVNSVIPDKPGHTFKQIAETWKSSGSGDLANLWATAVEQQDAVGGAMKVRGYGTAHNANGDLSYFSWEATSKVTPKEGGAVELTGSGQFNWLGGTGKSQKISGHIPLRVIKRASNVPGKVNPSTKCQ